MTSLKEFIYFFGRRKDLRHLVDSKNENSSRFQAGINEKKRGNESFILPLCRSMSRKALQGQKLAQRVTFVHAIGVYALLFWLLLMSSSRKLMIW